MLALDVRDALRSLARAPGFTLIALITLAPGIGGTSSTVTLVDGILLRPLPRPAADAMVTVVRSTDRAREDTSFFAAEFLAPKRHARSFARRAGLREDIVEVSEGPAPVPLRSLQTTAGFFAVGALTPGLGRGYSAADCGSGGRGPSDAQRSRRSDGSRRE